MATAPIPTEPDPMEKYDMKLLERQLDQAKSELFLGPNAGFLGPLMCSLAYQWQPGLGTAATDGVTIFWDPADFVGCTHAGRVSTLAHELGHVYRMHAARKGLKCNDIWNVACDICINRDLLENKYKLEWASPGIGPHPEIPFEMEEQIYDHLINPGGAGQAPGNMPGGTPGNIPGSCCSGIITPTQAQQQQNVNNVVQAMHSAIINNAAGDIPGNVKEIIKQFLKPVVPWESALQKFMTELVEEDYSWAKPNRRFQDMYLPSRTVDETGLAHLVCYQDVSGSVSTQDSIRFNSELKYIWDTFRPEKLTIVLFDTIIQEIFELEDGQQFDEIEITGRGGTDLRQVRQHILETDPTAVIIFSDLFVTPMEPGPKCPVLWIAIGNTDAKVKFGDIIYINA